MKLQWAFTRLNPAAGRARSVFLLLPQGFFVADLCFLAPENSPQQFKSPVKSRHNLWELFFQEWKGASASAQRPLSQASWFSSARPRSLDWEITSQR